MMCRAAAIAVAATCVLVIAHSAAAAPSVVQTGAAANATIVEGNAISINLAIAAPSVRGSREGAAFMGSVPSMLIGMMMIPGNARLTVRRDDDEGVPVTAPASFEVIGAEGDNALIVRTTANSEVRIPGDGVILNGVLQGGSAASIDVGRGLIPLLDGETAATINGATLVVVVQYN